MGEGGEGEGGGREGERGRGGEGERGRGGEGEREARPTCSMRGMKVSTSRICAASSISTLSYCKREGGGAEEREGREREGRERERGAEEVGEGGSNIR